MDKQGVVSPYIRTYGSDEFVKVAERKEGLWQLAEEKLQGSRDDMHVLPSAVIQVQMLICRAIMNI